MHTLADCATAYERRPVIRVLIADDHPQIRLALRHVLETEGDFEVVGEAENGATAVEMAARTRPNLVVLDYRMPHLNGLEAARRILERFPDVALIMMSGDDDPVIASEAVDAGVSTYVSKTGRPDELVSAMRRAATTEI
jgi:DNA-binding NarL/FixJ family response regulator